jgi:uncharacterized hydrophobic protein (TIGR00271 family)
MKNSDVDHGQLAHAARTLLALLRQRFSLRADTDYAGAMQQVRTGAEFHSGNAWALTFAIVIASVGLNVNSTAVIIGAMLISPLMGPIVGAGFGLATNDFTLLRRSVRNLLLQTVVALVASTLYFTISPLEAVQSELLARTRPTLYDVLIAFFGGAAGVVAVSRKFNMGNVVPGVAIATALMPPLCTAGFGLAQGNVWFFLGALHLFLINALFICLSTVVFVRLMHFERVAELHPEHLTRTRAVITLMVLAIGVPSVYTGWWVIQEARFQQAARRFIAENLEFPDRVLLNVDLRYSGEPSTISATILGQPLPEETVRTLERQLPKYGLEQTRLVLNQPVDTQKSLEQIGQMVRQGVLEDLYKRNEEALSARESRIRVLEEEVVKLRSAQFPLRELANELAALYPALVSISIGREAKVLQAASDSTAVLAVASWRKMPSAAEQSRLRSYLALRLKIASLRLVNLRAR